MVKLKQAQLLVKQSYYAIKYTPQVPQHPKYLHSEMSLVPP